MCAVWKDCQGKKDRTPFNPLHSFLATLLCTGSQACMAVVVLIPTHDSLVDPQIEEDASQASRFKFLFLSSFL